MKWTGNWWGIEILAENEEDNSAIDALLARLEKKPTETYVYGDLEVETEKGLRKVIFNR